MLKKVSIFFLIMAFLFLGLSGCMPKPAEDETPAVIMPTEPVISEETESVGDEENDVPTEGTEIGSTQDETALPEEVTEATAPPKTEATEPDAPGESGQTQVTAPPATEGTSPEPGQSEGVSGEWGSMAENYD